MAQESLMQGKARKVHPDAVVDGEIVEIMTDQVGRGVSRPVQVRDLVQTAYVTGDEVQENSLIVGVGGEFHDLIYVTAANESDAAINLDFRQTTGGTVQFSIELPATDSRTVSPPVPTPQDAQDAAWTVQNSAADNSNTVYSVTGLFSKEV